MYNRDNTKEADCILERITFELERQGKTQAELVAFLDLPRGSFSSWKARRSRSFCEHLGAIAEYLKLDVNWLVTGETKSGSVNAAEELLLEEFRKLSAEKQDAVIQNVKWLGE